MTIHPRTVTVVLDRQTCGCLTVTSVHTDTKAAARWLEHEPALDITDEAVIVQTWAVWDGVEDLLGLPVADLVPPWADRVHLSRIRNGLGTLVRTVRRLATPNPQIPRAPGGHS